MRILSPLSPPTPPPELGTVPSASERADQDYLSEPGTNVPKGGSTEEGWAPGNHSQKGRSPGSDTGEMEPEQGAPSREVPER